MKVRLLAIASCILLTACIENTARQMTPLVPAVSLGDARGNPVFETADKWSFSRAAIRYPARNGSHTIQAGDYLLFGLSDALRGSSVRDLRLTVFENKSRMGFGLAGRHLMSLDVEVTCTIDGAARAARFTMAEKDVGMAHSGDYSPIPFVLNLTTDDGLFHKQLRPVIDGAIASLVAQIARPG